MTFENAPKGTVDAELAERAKSDPELKARLEAHEQRERDRAKVLADLEAARKHQRRIRRLTSRGIGAHHAAMLVAAEQGQELLRTAALGHVKRFLADPELRILVLAGGVGLGKTFAMSCAISQECPEPPVDWALPSADSPYDDGWEIYRDPTMVAEEIERKRCWPAERHPRMIASADVTRILDDDQLRPYARCSMLGIDDVGVEHVGASGWALSVLDRLINARYARALRTILTTNLSAEQFRERFGERVADRIRECGEFVGLTGESLRRRNQ